MRSYPAERRQGEALRPSRRRQLADTVRALLEAEPTITRSEVQRRTKAPENLCRAVMARWRERRGQP